MFRLSSFSSQRSLNHHVLSIHMLHALYQDTHKSLCSHRHTLTKLMTYSSDLMLPFFQKQKKKKIHTHLKEKTPYKLPHLFLPHIQTCPLALITASSEEEHLETSWKNGMASHKTIKRRVLKMISGLQSEKAAVVVYRPSEGATDRLLVLLLSWADDYVRYWSMVWYNTASMDRYCP